MVRPHFNVVLMDSRNDFVRLLFTDATNEMFTPHKQNIYIYLFITQISQA